MHDRIGVAMCKNTIVLCAFALLASDHLTASALERPHRGRVQAPEAQAALPYVEVSSVTVDPKELHVTRSRGQESTSAKVTVQVFHQPVTSEQTIVLELGTARTDPPGLQVSYDPPQQTLRLSPSDPGPPIPTVT